jgi:two-component system, chemotaxis family, chemotaxis protein CheY
MVDVKGQVLVVEDDADIREALVEVFRDHGFDATGAWNGREGLDKIQGGGLRPCLIVLDLMMPIMNGAEFSESLHQIPEVARTPIVVISAHRDVDRTVQEIGAVAHLHKPIKIADLIAVAGEYCERQRLRR